MRNNNKTRKLVLLDATLREGEQSKEINLNYPHKKKIISMLDEYGVDYIEIGYAEADVKLLKRLIEDYKGKLKNSRLTVFGSTKRKAIKAADDKGLNAILETKAKTATLFGKTWLLHIETVLGLTAEENLKSIHESVKYLIDNGIEVIYDTEHFFDGYFDNREYALECLKQAADAGASWLVLCDTKGATKTKKVIEVIQDVKQYLEKDNIKSRLGVHFHNDKGMAVANSLTAADYGAEMIQVTANGFGERTGNADLFTVACGLELDKEFSIKMNTKKSVELSKAMYKIFNLKEDVKQPFVGSCAFAHKAGMHIDILKKTGSEGIEICKPELVGNQREEVLSDISGGATALRFLANYSINVDKKDPRVKAMIEETKDMYNKGYDLTNETEKEILVAKHFLGKKDFFDVHEWDVITGKKKEDKEAFSQSVVVSEDGSQYVAKIRGGPVDAQYKAIQKILKHEYPDIEQLHLADFESRIAKFKEESSSVVVRISYKYNGNTFSTEHVSDDILEASKGAIVKGFNYFLWKVNENKQNLYK